MRTLVKKSLLAIAVSGVIASPAVNATNGYFSHGYSTKEKGLAGAGTAFLRMLWQRLQIRQVWRL